MVLLFEDRVHALEVIASQHHYTDKDITVLANILSLAENADVAYVKLETPSSSHHHYVMRLKKEKTPEQIEKMLRHKRLEWGMYDGKPFYNFPTQRQDAFYLRILQPWDEAR